MSLRKVHAFLPAIAAVALLGAEHVAAQDAASPGRTQLALRMSRELLSNRTPDWTDVGLEVAHEFARRKVLSGSVVDSSRFGVNDRTLAVEGYYPLSRKTTGYLMASASDTHRVLARSTVHAQVAHELGDGWGLIGGLRHASYDATSVDIADLTVEKYFSDFRAAYTLLPARSSTAGGASSQRLQVAYYYGDGSRVQFVHGWGTEVDRPSGIGLVVATNVRSTGMFGRHWLSRDWGVDYGVGRTTQGTVVRTAASVGLRLRF